MKVYPIHGFRGFVHKELGNKKSYVIVSRYSVGNESVFLLDTSHCMSGSFLYYNSETDKIIEDENARGQMIIDIRKGRSYFCDKEYIYKKYNIEEKLNAFLEE